MPLSRTLSLLPLTVFALLLTTLVHADFQSGLDAHKRGDYKTAFSEYLPLAEQGMVEAQYNLGVIYRDGDGVPQSYQEAVRWFKLAAEQGLVEAHYNLGVMYSNGQGVPQDYQEAVRWYRFAAEQGYADAQHNLGLRYFNGEGVPQDYVLAHMWLNLSAAQNSESAIKHREVVAKRLTSNQIAEAQRLAREWLAQH